MGKIQAINTAYEECLKICDDELLYIGECLDLMKRFNSGYGNISPKNCYIGGQPTNCKINSLILKEYHLGKKIYLYFYKTSDYKQAEKIFLQKIKPKYNSR